MINDTYGQNFGGSLQSKILQSYLENRLLVIVDLNGSIEYQLIWKQKDTPLGRSIYLLRASARPIIDRVYGGWATVRVRDDGRTLAAHRNYRSKTGRRAGSSLQVQVRSIIGPHSILSNVMMGSAAVLNPEHARWLMGFPAEWLKCMDWETL